MMMMTMYRGSIDADFIKALDLNYQCWPGHFAFTFQRSQSANIVDFRTKPTAGIQSKILTLMTALNGITALCNVITILQSSVVTQTMLGGLTI